MMYTIINDKKINIITLNSFFKRFIGLMFKKNTITDIYMFPNCFGIHTFFMRQKIDLCFLDKDYKIIDTVSCVKKNKVMIRKSYYVLEMPLDTARYLEKGKILNIYNE